MSHVDALMQRAEKLVILYTVFQLGIENGGA
jgi:hypothetical protein